MRSARVVSNVIRTILGGAAMAGSEASKSRQTRGNRQNIEIEKVYQFQPGSACTPFQRRAATRQVFSLSTQGSTLKAGGLTPAKNKKGLAFRPAPVLSVESE